MIIVAILNNWDQYRDLDCKNTNTWKAHVLEWLHEYGDVFSKNKSERIPIWKLYDYTIDFVEDTMLPKPAKIYLFSLVERNSLNTWINKQLRKWYIQPSTSLIAAPFFFVKKHNGSLQPIMDYRALNGITVKNCYPIPRIANLIGSLSKASIFIKINLRFWIKCLNAWETISFLGLS